MLILLRNCDVYSPKHLGIRDILLCNQKIIHIAEHIEKPCGLGPVEVIHLQGQRLVPGFIDQHVHLIGGGGEGGPSTRTPEVQLSDVTTSGVTTVVGCLGTDGTTRHMTALLAKARALEIEGITTYIYTGAYQIPTPTITGSVRDDVILIDKVIGVGELAISDHRSAAPSTLDVLKMAAEARVGGLLGGKPGLCHLHVGPSKRGLQPLFDMLEMGDVPISQFTPTHCDRTPELIEDSIRFAKLGGKVDLTAGSRTANTLLYMLKKGVELDRITFSSDGNGSMPRFDDKGNLVGLGIGSLKTSYEVVRSLVLEHGLSLAEALQPITTTVANTLLLKGQKGVVQVGADADLVVLDKELTISTVFALGRIMVREGEAVVKGTFEK